MPLEDAAPFIRKQRRRLGLTQRDLAAKVGVDHTYISKLERAALDRSPSEATLRAIADALDIEPEYLLCMTGAVDCAKLRDVAARDPRIAYALRRIAEGELYPLDGITLHAIAWGDDGMFRRGRL